MGTPLLIGSNNAGKVRELAELLAGMPWDVKSLEAYPEVPEPIEDGSTFEENAILKAEYFVEKFGIACVADDSGLVTDALDGAPGVYSARYAGEECDPVKNIAKLLAAMEQVPWHERTARFVCCAAFAAPGQTTHIEMAAVEGHISVERFGDGGFGYDPIFVPEDHERTFAEMEPEEKHAISHRGRAFSKLRKHLAAIGKAGS